MAQQGVKSLRAGLSGILWDYAVLFKHKLTLFVVFSAVMSYLASLEGPVNWHTLLILFTGGFCITGAANALNQVLEKDYDKLMSRTADRPVASGRMSSGHAVIVAGVTWMAGMILLAYLSPLAAFLGAMAVISYAFIYTPYKRVSPIAVFVGAFPGAVPLLIGNVAAIGHITQIGVFLFAIQFIWQFPHFWAIGWLGFDEYKIAGYKLIASKDGERDPKTGIHSAIYAFLFIPLAIIGYAVDLIGIPAMVIISAAAIGFAFCGMELYWFRSRKAALKLMFGSLIFLAIVLGVVYIEKMI